MADNASRWLAACGIGCGVLVIVLVVIGISGGFFLKQQFQGVIDAGASQEELTASLGRIEDYQPAPDGFIPRDRMEVFLTVRGSLSASQARIDALVADFPPDEVLREDSSPFSKVMSVIRGAGGLLDPLAGYIEARNRVLLESGMSMGEYLYIYTTAYVSWLGHSPEDGPMITKGKGPDDPPDRMLGEDDSDWSPARTRIRYRRYAMALLRNQLDQVEKAVPVDEALRAQLREELARFERSPAALLWEDGLPEKVLESVEPYRARLENTYHSTTNCFEFPRPSR